VYFRMKQERVNSKVFAPERPRNADVSKVLVFSARINSYMVRRTLPLEKH